MSGIRAHPEASPSKGNQTVRDLAEPPSVLVCDPALRSVLRALVRVCPLDDLVARLVYLVDWRSAITRGSQTTRTAWRIDGRGPHLADVEAAAREVRDGRTLSDILLPTPTRRLPDLDDESVASLDHVLSDAATMDRLRLVRLVMSTYPVMTADPEGRPPVADLGRMAERYRAVMRRAA